MQHSLGKRAARIGSCEKLLGDRDCLRARNADDCDGSFARGRGYRSNGILSKHVKRLLLGIDITRQSLGSNFYWSAGYTYLMQESVMGVRANKNRFRLEAGYFFSQHWSMRVFTNGSIGQGYDSSHFTERQSEEWYHHDQTSKHNFAIAGIGASYSPNPRYTVSLSCAGMYWGRTVHDLKHAYELSVARSF